MASRIVWDQAALNLLLRNPLGDVGRDMLRRGRAVAQRAKSLVSSQSGRLAADIHVEGFVDATGPGSFVGSDLPYARFVHEGTGIYGTTGRLIRPESGGVLAWEGADGAQFARYSRGQPGQKYLERALPAARD